MAVVVELDGTGEAIGRHGSAFLRPHAHPARPPRRLEPRVGLGAISRSTPTTPSRTPASSSARRSPRRSARRPASAASPRSRCRSTRRSSTWPSTSPAGRICTTTSSSGRGGAARQPAVRRPAGRGVLARLCPLGGDHPAHRAPPRAQPPPRPRGVLQGGRQGASRRRADRGRRHPLDQGHACSAAGDRCPRLRHRQSPLGGEGAAARRRRRPPRRQPRRRRRMPRESCCPASGPSAPAPGHFATSGLDEVVRRCISDGRPFLGICVGLQLLFEGSEEDPEVPGLGVLAGHGASHRRVRAPAADAVEPRPRGRRARLAAARATSASSWYYFVHSYAPGPRGREASGERRRDL